MQGVSASSYLEVQSGCKHDQAPIHDSDVR